MRLTRPETKTIVLPSGKLFLIKLVPFTPRKPSAYKRRKQREAAAGIGWTAAEWRTLCAKYGDHCLNCGESILLVPDHVTPLVSGGPHALSNIQPLCVKCNFRKGLQIIDYRSKHASYEPETADCDGHCGA